MHFLYSNSLVLCAVRPYSSHSRSPCQPPTLSQPRYWQLRLIIADLAANKTAGVNRGVFLPLSNLVDGSLTFTLSLDVSSTEGIPDSVLET